MDSQRELTDEIKKSMEKFNQNLKDMKSLVEFIDTITEPFETLDKQLTPIYERFKKISDVFDKIELINNTVVRMKELHSVFQKAKKDLPFSIFQ